MEEFDIIEATNVSKSSLDVIQAGSGAQEELDADQEIQKKILEEISWCKWWGKKVQSTKRSLLCYIVYGYRGRVTVRQHSSFSHLVKVRFYPHLLIHGGEEWHNRITSFESEDLTLGGVLLRLETNLKSKVHYETIENGDVAALTGSDSDVEEHGDYSSTSIDKLNTMLACHHPVSDHPPVTPAESDQLIVSLILKWALEFEWWAVSSDKKKVIVRTSDGRILFTVPDLYDLSSPVYVDSYPNRVNTPGNRFRKRYRFRLTRSDLKRLSDALVNQMGKKISFHAIHDGLDIWKKMISGN